MEPDVFEDFECEEKDFKLSFGFNWVSGEKLMWGKYGLSS